MLAGALFLGCNQPTGPLSLPAAVGRPAEASQGPRVGVIVARGGEVTIVPSKGTGFPGLPEQQLLRDDRLVTAVESFVVVQLHNGHLVRLGASQSNVVEMLAPFHDPPATDDIEARFVRLLSPAERDDPTLSGAITRVAGWNTRMSASESFAALPAVEASRAPAPLPAEPVVAPVSIEEAAPIQDARQGSAPDDEPFSDAKSQARVPKAPQPAKIGGSRKPADSRLESDDEVQSSKKGKRAEEAKTEVEVESAPGAGSSPPPPPPSSPHLPAKVKFIPASGGTAQTVDLPTPLKAGSAALAACAGAGAKVTGSVVNGKLIALKVDGAAKCQELVGKASTLENGSFELTVMP